MSQRHVNPLPFTTLEEACQLYNVLLWMNGQLTDEDVDESDWELFDSWMLNFEDKLQRLGGFDTTAVEPMEQPTELELPCPA